MTTAELIEVSRELLSRKSLSPKETGEILGYAEWLCDKLEKAQERIADLEREITNSIKYRNRVLRLFYPTKQERSDD